jgi:excisionase family DNA binding protein
MQNRKRLDQDKRAEAENRLQKMLEIAGLQGRSAFRPQEIADLFQISLTTVYRMIDEGKFKRIATRAIIRIDYLSLLDFMVQQSQEAGR